MKRLPTPYAFDHVVVALDVGSHRYIVDPTLSYQRGDQLALRHIGRYGPYLRIAAKTTGLERANLGDYDTNATTYKEVFQVDAIEQPATFTVVTIAEGRAADALRLRFATRSLEQISREYLDYYTRYFSGISLLKPIETKDDPKQNSFSSTEYYQVKDLFTSDANKQSFRAEFQPASIWDYARTPNLAQRTQPFAISHPTRIRQQTTINLPEEWKVTPNDEKVSDAAFTLEARAKNLSSNVVFTDYQWQSAAYFVEPSRIADYSAQAEKARKALGYQLTWTKPAIPGTGGANAGSTEGTENLFPLNWPMVVLAAGVVSVGGYLSQRIIRRRNPNPPEPPVIALAEAPNAYHALPRSNRDLEGLGGWLILVGFGLFFRPFLFVKAIYEARSAYFNEQVWHLLTIPGGNAYNAQFGLVAPLELIYHFGMAVFCSLLLILFFRRSHLFPRTMQIFLGSMVLGAIFAVWDAEALGQVANQKARIENYSGIFQAIFAASIWIPYFQVSRRVKATFIR